MIFPPFHIEIEGKCGWIIGGGEGMLAPSPHSSYAYVIYILGFLRGENVRGVCGPWFALFNWRSCDR